MSKGKKGKAAQDRVIFFDTTLRDGEQAPGFSMNIKEKLEIAHQLARLGVHVIEAGFPISSEGDFEAVSRVAEEVKGPTICGLARAKELDITRAGEAVKKAERRRIHTFIATSPVHMEKKLRLAPAQVIETAVASVKLAKSLVEDVEFSCEDAARSDRGFLVEIITAAIEAGAGTINIPDTVGYSSPWRFGELIKHIKEKVLNIDQAIISVHCHNDLGLAVANSLAGVVHGARQVECTINGIGERAGNASLEEIVMNLKVRKDFYQVDTDIKTEELFPTCKLVAQITGRKIPPNKAIVGANAFAHESGIHQDGVLKERTTYEIMKPEDVGWRGVSMVIGKHSGRHAFKQHLENLGFRLTSDELERAFKRFKDLCDTKKEIYYDDLYALVHEELMSGKRTYELVYVHTTTGTNIVPTATVKVKRGEEIFMDAANGDGPVDAAFNAIDRIVGKNLRLEEYSLDALTGGKDAIGRVTVVISGEGKVARGRGMDTDIILASAKAYMNAINVMLIQEELFAEKRGM